MIRVLVVAKVFSGDDECVDCVDWAEIEGTTTEAKIRDGLVNELAQDIANNGVRDLKAALLPIVTLDE